ncbi:MAG: FAD-binding oxidoreductase [candidate division WOR-3 bacterium]
MLYIQGVIKEKTILTPEIFGLWVSAPEISQMVQPGQFVNVRVTQGCEPFLNRPFSVADTSGNAIYLVIKIVGQGTEILHHRRIGDKLGILGPLGKPVKIPEQRKVLLVGGGVGLAPLYFLAKRIKNNNELHLIMGAKRRPDLIMKKDFLKLTKNISIATEDGSSGTKGTAVTLLKRLLKKESFDLIYTCGPRAMLIAIKDLHLKIPALAFIEDFLGCGCGICLGCAIKVNNEYKRICTDGPVFDLRKVSFGN